MSIGFATLASAGSTARSASAVSGGELGQLEPGRLAGVGAEDPEAAGVGQHRDAAAARERLRREQHRRVDQLVERRRADHTRLVEERVDRSVGACERRGMRAGGACARRGSSRTSWPGSASCARAGARSGRTCGGCRTTRGRAGRRRCPRRPPSTRAGRSTRRRPCSRSRRTPEKVSARSFAFSSSARPSAPLCDENPTLPGGSAFGPKVAFRRGAAAAMPRQFGPTRRAPWARTSASSACCRVDALRAELGEAGRDDAQRLDALAQRLLGGRDDAFAGQADQGEIDVVRDLGDRRVSAHACDRLGLQVDRVGGAAEVRAQDVAEQLASDRAPALRGAEHGDRARGEERLQRGGGGDVVAALDALLVGGRRLETGTRSRTRPAPAPA